VPHEEPKWGEPVWAKVAEKHYSFFSMHEPRIADKIDELIEAVMEDPFHGIGRPKYLGGGHWTRKITEEHRLFYSVRGDVVYITSCYGHDMQ